MPGKGVEEDFGKSRLRAALEDDGMKGHDRFETAPEGVALDENGRVNAELGCSLHPPQQVDAAAAVESQRFVVARPN
jgi:hypothetical protein